MRQSSNSLVLPTRAMSTFLNPSKLARRATAQVVGSGPLRCLRVARASQSASRPRHTRARARARARRLRPRLRADRGTYER